MHFVCIVYAFLMQLLCMFNAFFACLMHSFALFMHFLCTSYALFMHLHNVHHDFLQKLFKKVANKWIKANKTHCVLSKPIWISPRLIFNELRLNNKSIYIYLYIYISEVCTQISLSSQWYVPVPFFSNPEDGHIPRRRALDSESCKYACKWPGALLNGTCPS
jgi:hypothetical protein